MTKILKVNEDFKGIRLDIYLTENIKGKSRSYFKRLINEEKITVNNKVIKSNYKVKLCDEVEILQCIEEKICLSPEAIDLDILYEDDYLLVINKPQGMVVHPAIGNNSGTLVNALLNHCDSLSKVNGEDRPGIVHRIDKDTSGILIVAKNDLVHENLAKQLKDHTMKRVYIALCEGVIKEDNLIINKPLGRDIKNRIKKAVVEDGRKAVTHVKVLTRFENYTLLECRLETGRTHQIRVHLASMGHPLVGDPLYGYKKQKFNLKGQMLHAAVLGFIHPISNEYMELKTDIPKYFKELLPKLR